MTGLRLLPCLLILAVFLAALPVSAQDVQIFPEQSQTVRQPVSHPFASASSVPVDSLYYDDGDNDIDFSFSVSGADELYAAVRFDAESDFELTHVRFWGRRDGDAVSGDVTVDVYDGAGFTPDGSTLLYSQTYPGLLTESNQFRYVGLDTPLSFGAGEAFFIVVRADSSPEPGGPLGGDDGPGTGDYEGRSFFGTADLGWIQAGDISGAAGIGAENVSSIGAFYSAADAPLVWMSYASSKFVQAEALLITSGPGAAQPVFEEAIRADMQFLGVPGAEIDAYIASLPALTDAGVDARELLLTQKYIANFLHTEPYNDFRRTGYPDLQPVDVPEARVDLIPLRFPYPSSELSRNAANVPAYVPIGFDALRVPVWWDTTLPPGALPNPTQ